MLNAAKDQASVFQTLEVSEATYLRLRAKYGGIKATDVKRLNELQVESKKLKRIAAQLCDARRQRRS
jgi:hypothetical protein